MAEEKTESTEKGACTDAERMEVAKRLLEAANAARAYVEVHGEEPTDGCLVDMIVGAVDVGRPDIAEVGEFDAALLWRLAELVSPRPLRITMHIMPVKIRYKDEPEHVHDVLFCLENPEDFDIDDRVAFWGYARADLLAMVGAESAEDFDVLEVGEWETCKCRRVR